MASQRSKNLKETFRLTPQPPKELFGLPEQPSDEITAKILLKKPVSLVLKDLNTDKQFVCDGMEAHADGKNSHAIIVRGIPPDWAYGAQNILTVVKIYDKDAKVIP